MVIVVGSSEDKEHIGDISEALGDDLLPLYTVRLDLRNRPVSS